MAPSLNVKDMKLYSEAESLLNDVSARGFTADQPLEVGFVSQFDQLHYHGVESVQQAIDDLGISSSDHILEVGAGWGGPSRYIAAQTGANLTALELQQDFSTVGAEITRRCGLSHLIHHQTADFLDVDYGQKRFDHVVSWLALYHIPRRAEYTAKIYDLLRDEGTLFIEDLTKGPENDQTDAALLKKELFSSSMVSHSDYIQSLTDAGFEIIYADDMTADWHRFTSTRLELFDQNRAAYVAIHGEALFADKRHFYAKIVEYFTSSAIGGIRVAARRV
ncbi:MAG: SAM-dependent methyltransferase [Alphaproteobacteria bacterium]